MFTWKDSPSVKLIDVPWTLSEPTPLVRCNLFPLHRSQTDISVPLQEGILPTCFVFLTDNTHDIPWRFVASLGQMWYFHHKRAMKPFCSVVAAFSPNTHCSRTCHFGDSEKLVWFRGVGEPLCSWILLQIHSGLGSTKNGVDLNWFQQSSVKC